MKRRRLDLWFYRPDSRTCPSCGNVYGYIGAHVQRGRPIRNGMRLSRKKYRIEVVPRGLGLKRTYVRCTDPWHEAHPWPRPESRADPGPPRGRTVDQEQDEARQRKRARRHKTKQGKDRR